MSYQPNNIFINSFFNITNALKYIVLFILYILAFYYLFIKNTIPISFLLLLILHIFILGVTISDSKILDYTIFKFDEIDNFPFPVINTVFKYLIYTGPVISWILLLISLSFMVYIFSRLNYYYNKSGDSLYLDQTENNDFNSLKSVLISSYIIIAILYGINISSISKNTVNDKLNEYFQQVKMSSLINRLFMTSILLFSFLLYFRLISVKNYTLFWIIMASIILLYAFNFILDYQKSKIFRNFKLILILIGCFIGLVTMMGSLISFVIYKNYDSLIALIPLLVWFIYLIYMGVCLFNKNNYLFNFNISYIIILLIIVLCILSLLSVYYGIKLNNEL